MWPALLPPSLPPAPALLAAGTRGSTNRFLENGGPLHFLTLLLSTNISFWLLMCLLTAPLTFYWTVVSAPLIALPAVRRERPSPCPRGAHVGNSEMNIQ